MKKLVLQLESWEMITHVNTSYLSLRLETVPYEFMRFYGRIKDEFARLTRKEIIVHFDKILLSMTIIPHIHKHTVILHTHLIHLIYTIRHFFRSQPKLELCTYQSAYVRLFMSSISSISMFIMRKCKRPQSLCRHLRECPVPMHAVLCKKSKKPPCLGGIKKKKGTTTHIQAMCVVVTKQAKNAMQY